MLKENEGKLSDSKTLVDKDSKPSTLCKCFSLKITTPFSNITTNLVGKRLLASLIPVKSDFLTNLDEKPDLYGPFWIYATIIFCLAAAGNLSTYIQTPSTSTFAYDFSYLPMAFFLVFVLGYSIPLLMYCIFRIFGADTSMTECVCLYGYSLFVFIPISFVCIVDSEYCKWAVVVYGAMSTTVFISVNYWKRMNNVQPRNKYSIVIIIIILQFLLFFLFKYYFFQSVYSSSSTTEVTSTSSTVSALQLVQRMYQFYRIK